MNESIAGLKRSHMCGEVTEKTESQNVTVMGWVNKRRKLGQLIFVTVRDRTGVVQVVVDENKASGEVYEKASAVRGEFVVAVSGLVIPRTPENINPEMPTGHIEIEASEFRILSESEVPPFQVADTGVKEDLRLKYRYLDLRRPEMAANIITRHKIAAAVRNYLNGRGFLDIETPILTKSTPEGARDYLVPSRISQGSFYALPQSPQIMKQILMIAGFDKYYQLCRCFRDEDLRADRQPEFTQIDIEMSFVEAEDVQEIAESMMRTVFNEILNIKLPSKFRKITYKEAMERYGSDKPDDRFGMELVNISDMFSGSAFSVFKTAVETGGSVRGIKADGCGGFSRRQLDSLADIAKTYKAKGLYWLSAAEDGTIKSPLAKFFSEGELNAIASRFDAKAGDLILICADSDNIVFDALGSLRLELASTLNLTGKDTFSFLWVTEFPLLEWDAETNRFYAKHHPFTAPMDEDLLLFESNPAAMRAKAYDLVLNGYELGGGSIRIYQKQIQERMFNTLGMSYEEASAQFSFLMEAFKYGAPPHGGIALGLDRICMLMTGSSAIRDCIAFPKVKDASCPLTGAPGNVSANQLKELGIQIAKPSAI